MSFTIYCCTDVTQFNFNAFLGVGHKILTMLKNIRKHPLYALSEDSTIVKLLREYSIEHSYDVSLDYENVAFDFTDKHERTTLTLKEQKSVDSLFIEKDNIFSDFYRMFMLYLQNKKIMAMKRTFLRNSILDLSPLPNLKAVTSNETSCEIKLTEINVSCFITIRLTIFVILFLRI